MSARERRAREQGTQGRSGRSVVQRIANEGHARGLSRGDALTAFAIDRWLFRLGRSQHAGLFALKDGVLLANLMDAPHRFTRDIDLLRRRGPVDVDDLREKFRAIVTPKLDDGIHFDANAVRAELARREFAGYDGIKVSIRARVGGSAVDLSIDVGFGDAVVPPARRIRLRPFFAGDTPPCVYAYSLEPALAEKIETVLARFPAIRHRLKDILDVITLAATESFDGASLADSLRATMERRATAPDACVLDDLRLELRGRTWLTDWAMMRRDKAVTCGEALHDAIDRFDAFVRPLLTAIAIGSSPGHWRPGGPWSAA